MKKISTAHFILLLTVASQFLLSWLIVKLEIELPVTAALLLSQLSILLPFAVYCIITKQNPLKTIRFKRIKISTAVLAVAIAIFSYPVVVVLNLISMLFVENAMADIMPQVLSMGVIPGVILMAFLPAVVEETVFRGMLYNTYSKRRPIVGILLSAVLFGLMHMNFNQMPYAIYLGIVMALVMEACDSILAPMIIHFTMNASSTIMAFFSLDSLEATTDSSLDFKSLLMESYQMSAEQMGMELTEAQLYEMMPALIASMVVMFAVFALIALSIVGTLIYAVFRSNNRKPREVFKADRTDTEYLLRKNGTMHKNRMLDLWVIIFIIYTIYNCIISIGI